MNEILIDGLWILDVESGLCFFEENYRKWSLKDTQLISSFLTAIRNFIREAFSEDIEFIQFKSRKIIFEVSGRSLFIIAVSKSNSNEEKIRITIKEIVKRFNKKFHSILKNNRIIKDFRQFRNFSEDLEHIIDREPVNVKFLIVEQIERLYKKRNNRRIRRIDEIKRCN